MPALLRRLTLLAALVGACGEPTAAPADPPAPVADAARLEPGEVHRYALEWRTRATRSLARGGVSGGLELTGELAVAAVARGPEGTRVAAWLPRVDTGAIVVQGQPIAVDPAALVGPRAEFLLAPDGDVRRVFFAADGPPIFRELMLGVLARLDLRGAGEPGTRTVRGGHGLALASYRREADGVVLRELAGVLRFDTVPGAAVDPADLTAAGRIELDERGVPVRIDLHDVALLQEELGLVADDEFTAVRTAVEPAEVAALVDPVELDLHAGPDLEAAARELDRQYAAGYTLHDLALAMDTMDGGVLPRTGEASRAAAALRAEPGRAADLVPLIRAAGKSGRQLGFDVLSAAGTPEAQAVMCALLREASDAAWPERALLVQRFAFVHAPTAASGELMLELVAAAERSGDLLLRRAALFPLGTVAGRVADGALAERLHATLVAHAGHADADLRAAAVGGLGNARRADDLPRLLAALSDPHGGVRVEAAAGLRTRVTPAATEALLAALADDDPAVASRALVVLRKHHYQGSPDPALVERARLGRYNPRLARALASSLLGERERPDVRAALDAVAASADDRQLAADLGLAAAPP
ncbi:MAG: hypothetical protein JNL82_07895 [Myxococcales bacterium]|nr:hypothetical protein [Myxococcales bacterium]